jgi:hypothetical protein
MVRRDLRGDPHHAYPDPATVAPRIDCTIAIARFDPPGHFCIENFFHFPVGTIVPLGFYDRDLGKWLPFLSGRVARILGLMP